MISAKRYLIIFLMVLPAFQLRAQDLTGTWEGNMGTYQFLQLNMVQKGDKICGYTWDYLKLNHRSYCKAYFEAKFDKQTRKLIIYGTSFIENSGSHTFMELELDHKYVNDREVLSHKATFMERLEAAASGEQVETNIYLKKISDKPSQFLPGMQDCLDEVKKVPDSAEQFQVPAYPGDNPKTVVVPETAKDTVKQIPVPVKIPEDSATIPELLEKRKNIEQSHIEVNVKTINLKVYDNAIMDGDTVSILYNGKLLLSHQLLSEKAIEINLELDPTQTRHEITLFAENLGSIPPNTALIVITAGEKRYELFASASLQENAVLVFDYRPK